jgi:hypothetical protein
VHGKLLTVQEHDLARRELVRRVGSVCIHEPRRSRSPCIGPAGPWAQVLGSVPFRATSRNPR